MQANFWNGPEDLLVCETMLLKPTLQAALHTGRSSLLRGAAAVMAASSLRTRDSGKIHISSAFDGGNIIAGDVSEPSNIKLQIRPDPECKKDGGKTHFQWFHFQVSGACLSPSVQRCLVLPPLSPHRVCLCAGAAGQPLVMHITNAGESSYPTAWPGYKAVASYDMQHWFRVQDTSYDQAACVLTIRHTPDQQCVRYAYFAPYSWERHTELVMRMQVCAHVLKEAAAATAAAATAPSQAHRLLPQPL